MGCERLRLLVEDLANEQTVQNEIEPCPDAITQGEYCLANALISKFPLGSDFVPDLTWVNPTSGATYIRFLELKAPRITIFRSPNQDEVRFSREFEAAYFKCEHMLQWLRRNMDTVVRTLAPLGRQGGEALDYIIGHCHLIAGRRHELSSIPRQRAFETRVQSSNFVHPRTWDGFLQSYCKHRNPRAPEGNSIRCVRYRRRDFHPKAGGSATDQ
jgi:hypothetical protein